MRLLSFLSLLASACGLFVVNPVETVPVCVNENTVLTPVPDNQTIVTRIAWPISGPGFQGAVSVNDVPATGPATILCMDCADPPCLPVTRCDPSTLYWSVAFNDLTVQPGRMILPDSPTLPPVLVTFYTPWAPSPSPTATPTVTPTASPSGAPAPARVSVTCDVCDKSAVVGLAVAFAFFVFIIGILVLRLRRRLRYVLCPFCEERMLTPTLRAHILGCKAHGQLFEPIVVDRVKTVNNAVIAVATHTVQCEDEVARPEAVLFVRQEKPV